MVDLHMLFGEAVSERIEKLARQSGSSFSRCVDSLLCLGLDRYEQKYYQRGNRQSGWKRVGGTPARKHVFISKRSYHRLKCLHVLCNVYSMGQIVRRVVSLVLFLVERWGLDCTVLFFRKGYLKNAKRRYVIGAKTNQLHMHMAKPLIAKFSAQMVPISMEYQ